MILFLMILMIYKNEFLYLYYYNKFILHKMYRCDPDTEIITNVCKKLIGSKIILNYNISLIDGEIHTTEFMDCNIIGNVMENIVFPFLQKKLPKLIKGPKQASPDFFNGEYELELKMFTGSPSFDIANYNSYIIQLEKDMIKKLYKTQYLIFKYSIHDQYVIIDDFKLHHIWNIISYTGIYPISLQNKRGLWYNIRPCSFQNMDIKKNDILFIKKICDSIKECPNIINDKHIIIESIKNQFDEIQKQNKLVNSLNEILKLFNKINLNI